MIMDERLQKIEQVVSNSLNEDTMLHKVSMLNTLSYTS